MALQCGNYEAERMVMEGVCDCVGTLQHLLSTAAEGKHTILKETAGLSTR